MVFIVQWTGRRTRRRRYLYILYICAK